MCVHLYVCVCISLYKTVVHNTAQNTSDNLASYPQDNLLLLLDVYWKRMETAGNTVEENSGIFSLIQMC